MTDYELGKFIRGTTGAQKLSHHELSHCALNLLQTLPVSQPAILHYLCNLFDEATNKNLFPREIGFDRIDVESINLDNVVSETCDVLLGIIHKNPGPWAPILSSWSFDLLGHISVKYANRLQLPQCASLNQVLQVWMTCPATKQLIHVAMECFAAMVTANPDICVDSLLESSVKYTPYFDWVVAHIGSCFPTTIITRVLMSGLKDFCIHGNAMDVSTGTSDDKSSKMSSVVGILGHLASKHGQDIRNALIHLFKESMEPEEDHMKMSTVTFLLQMASMSTLLLNIITTDFLAILTPDVLNTLHDQFYRWSSDNSDYFSLLSLVVHLVMKCEVGTYRVLNFLLKVASPDDDKYSKCKGAVGSTAVTLLDQLCVDLQRTSYNRRGNSVEISFLSSLSKHTHDVTKSLLVAHGRRTEWIQQILTYIALYFGEVSASDILCHILIDSETPQQLSHFHTLQNQLEVVYPRIFEQSISRFMDQLNSQPPATHYQMVTNLLSIVEARKTMDSQSIQNPVSNEMNIHIHGLITLLVHPDFRVALTTARLIQTIGLGHKCPSDVVLDMCNALCLMLFNIFTVPEYSKAASAFKWCKKCIQAVCHFSIARNILLRLLMELALLTDFCETLGGQSVVTKQKSAKFKPTNEVSLLKENRKHGLSLTLPQSHSSVFHAGIIGDGKRVNDDKIKISQDTILRNRVYFCDVLLISATMENPSNSKNSDQSDGSDVRYDPFFYTNESGRKLAELLVDMLTPDSLYNSILWPEEECVTLTIERDLHVTRQFNRNPVLWDVLDLYSTNQAFVCYLSPLLRSLLATVINQYDSSRHITPPNMGVYLENGKRVINCLRKGKQLPPPLCSIGQILPHISQYQVSLLLTNVWKYVKENPPKIDNTGKRNACDARYTAILQSILHNNIDTLGVYYSKFFSLTPAPS